MSSNGRIARRFAPDFVAFYQTDDHGLAWSNPVVDMSVGGVFLRTSKPLPPGTSFDVLLTDKKDPVWVRAKAKVMWNGRKCRHRGMGIRFEHTRKSMGAMRSLLSYLKDSGAMEVEVA